VAVEGDYAYVADGSAGLRVIGIGDKAHPAQVGLVDTPGIAAEVTLAGPYAYVADGFSGLRIIQITDPAHPPRWANSPSAPTRRRQPCRGVMPTSPTTSSA